MTFFLSYVLYFILFNPLLSSTRYFLLRTLLYWWYNLSFVIHNNRPWKWMVYQKVEGYGGRLCISRIIGSKSAGKWKNCYNLPNLFTLIKVKVIFLNLNTFYGTISSFISYILLLFSVTCGNEISLVWPIQSIALWTERKAIRFINN